MTPVLVSQDADPLVGRVIDGKYRILGPLGEGGMAFVYEATHLGLEHSVAIKFLRKELAIEPDVAERFAREARTIAQLDSDNIVKVLDVGYLEKAGPYIVMEHLEGEDLQVRLEREGPMSVEAASRYVTQAAAGLSQAHAKGIVHRDLKPENLFLARSRQGIETLKLLDFGISKHTTGKLSRLTQPQVAVGSPNYMAPEQLLAHDDIDARADVWSLGVVLFQLATGELPFTGPSVAEVYARVLHTEPIPPSQYRSDLPPAFDALVLRCLSKDPAQRPPDVYALALELREISKRPSRVRATSNQPAGDSASATGPVSVTTRLTLESFSSARRWRVVAAITGLLVASLGTLALAASSLAVRADVEQPGVAGPLLNAPEPPVPAATTPEPAKLPEFDESPIVVASSPRASSSSKPPRLVLSAARPAQRASLSHRAPPRAAMREAPLSDFGGRR